MKKTFCISRKNLPTTLPIQKTILLFIALDHWNATDLVRGICYTLFAVLWILSVINMVTEKPVHVFETEAKSKFQQKLEEMAKENGINLNKD